MDSVGRRFLVMRDVGCGACKTGLWEMRRGNRNGKKSGDSWRCKDSPLSVERRNGELSEEEKGERRYLFISSPPSPLRR